MKYVFLLFSILFLCSFEKLPLSKTDFFKKNLPELKGKFGDATVLRFISALDTEDLYSVLVLDAKGEEVPKFKLLSFFIEKVVASGEKDKILLLSMFMDSENVKEHDKSRINKIAIENFGAPFPFSMDNYRLYEFKQEHIVNKGDSLSLIAFRYYPKVQNAVKFIRVSNGLNSNVIRIKQKIKICSVKKITKMK